LKTDVPLRPFQSRMMQTMINVKYILKKADEQDVAQESRKSFSATKPIDKNIAQSRHPSIPNSLYQEVCWERINLVQGSATKSGDRVKLYSWMR
jgi:hypothetical protein